MLYFRSSFIIQNDLQDISLIIFGCKKTKQQSLDVIFSRVRNIYSNNQINISKIFLCDEELNMKSEILTRNGKPSKKLLFDYIATKKSNIEVWSYNTVVNIFENIRL